MTEKNSTTVHAEGVEGAENYTPEILVRRSTYEDIPAIMEVVQQAKTQLKADGSSQWQNGYPNKYTFIADIDAESSYVLTVDGVVAGTAMISYGEEAGYSDLREGQWAYPVEEYGPYAVIHRVAVSAQHRGRKVVDKLFKELLRTMADEGITIVRIDTHRKNLRMQKVLSRIGFEYAGVITLDHDPEDPTRLSYEGIIQNLLGLLV
ncbi:GNAT family N-acetyltransferase [Alloscardovia criceti]|uniref:GNAT family N-acetyltransferase n=1 Tax=Alloscardovia criceti TaxID=356828 RepID=UPI00036E263D|nr:GNAT family N-acetyltransferase [Alloscardovia criceti]